MKNKFVKLYIYLSIVFFIILLGYDTLYFFLYAYVGEVLLDNISFLNFYDNYQLLKDLAETIFFVLSIIIVVYILIKKISKYLLFIPVIYFFTVIINLLVNFIIPYTSSRAFMVNLIFNVVDIILFILAIFICFRSLKMIK